MPESDGLQEQVAEIVHREWCANVEARGLLDPVWGGPYSELSQARKARFLDLANMVLALPELASALALAKAFELAMSAAELVVSIHRS